jgi:glucokinase
MAIGNKTLRERSQGRYTSTEALVRDARQGEPQAKALWQDSVRSLAIGINSLINVLDPEAVILGGGIAQAGPDLFEWLTEALQRHEWCPAGLGVRILPASLGDLAGAYGAARQAILSQSGNVGTVSC